MSLRAYTGGATQASWVEGAMSLAGGLEMRHNAATAPGASVAAFTSHARWRAGGITSRWKRVVSHYGDAHVPMQVKFPTLEPDPVEIPIVQPGVLLDIIGTVTDPGIRVLII